MEISNKKLISFQYKSIYFFFLFSLAEKYNSPLEQKKITETKEKPFILFQLLKDIFHLIFFFFHIILERSVVFFFFLIIELFIFSG